MTITMTKTRYAVIDGRRLQLLHAGKTYELRDSVASLMVSNGYAKVGE